MQRIFLLSASLLFGSCAHVPPPVEPTPAEVKPEDTTANPEKKLTCASDGECAEAQLCIRNDCVDISKDLAECRDFRVQFGFNSVAFDPGAKRDLLRMARCLRADQAMRVTIQGNADERGTEEYNLQLGSKRASTIETYLVALGVSAGQVNTISYGENRPVCRAHDEACWEKNRRASVKPDSPKPESKK